MERGSTSEQLMAEMAWVRRLARALVRDPAAADDLAQDAWIVAAEKAPAEDRPLRPWLARVVKQLAHTRRRGELRRELREQAADPERAVPSPQELVERVELQRIVAGEVLALAEPYRSTVLLHFVEGYTSAEIARRLGIPDGTVRRRLKVALDQLRAALRARPDQPSKGWLAVLAPLATSPASSASAALGVFAMKKLVVTILVLVVVLAAALALFWKRGPGHAAPPGTADVTHTAPGAPPRVQAAKAFPGWLAQAGAPDRRIAGTVLAAGAPVAGATVRLGLIVDGAATQLLAETRSGADGTFDFGLQPAAVFDVSAAAADHSPASVIVEAADPKAHPDHVRLVLGTCGSRLFGSVTDASGGPIAKASLSVAGLSGGETDATGHYAMCLPSDATVVRVQAEGYGSVEERIGTNNGLLAMAGNLRRDFVLAPEAVLAGAVVDSSGRPIAGARVIARPSVADARGRIGPAWADSDGSGQFHIAGLAPAQYDLVASADGFASAKAVSAIARPASTSSTIRLVLGSVARVRGHVLLAGAPVAGAAVTATTAGGLPGRKSMSQQDGSFVLDGVPLGVVAFTAAPYEVRAPKLLTVDRAQVDGVKLEVAAASRIHGRITHDGKPVPGAQVATGDQAHTTRADEVGAYVLDGLAAGVAFVTAWDTHEKAFSSGKRLVLAPGDDQQVDLELDGSGEIKGVVVDESGQPVPSVYVEFVLASGADDACESMTDSAGQFDCPMLLGGDYTARVAPAQGLAAFSPASGRFPVVHVPPHEVVTGVRLPIRNERLSIHGVVVGEGGAPMPDVSVEAIALARGFGEHPSVMADVSGGFEIRDLARGSYTLHAHAADGSDGVVANVAAGGDPVTIHLTRPGAIDGTLTGFSSVPIVEATQTGNGQFVQARGAVDGATFSVTGLRPGHYAIEAKAGAEVDGQAVDVRSGETTHVALHSRGVGRVEGFVYEYGTTTPVVGMRCDGNLSMGGQMSGSPPDPTLQAYTDAAGHFAVATPLGRVRVFCFEPGGTTSMPPAGGDVDVGTSGIPHLVVYSVRPAFATPPGNVGLMLQPIVLPITVGRVDPHGPAATAGVQPGDHLVSIDGGPLDGVLPVGAWFLLLAHAPGTTATLGIERGGTTRQVTVPVVEGPP